MTNQIAVFLGMVIILAFVVDALFYGGTLPLFLMRQFAALIEWVSFWR